MEDLEFVTYCGLYCGLCGERARIPARACALREAMVKEGYEFWGSGLPRFGDFWGFLIDLCDPDHACPGCRQGGGPPFCAIRKCAPGRGVDVCPFCDEYPCERALAIAKGYPTLLADGQRMREIGLERWIEEQQERAGTGFAYADIRCYPYSVPEQ